MLLGMLSLPAILLQGLQGSSENLNGCFICHRAPRARESMQAETWPLEYRKRIKKVRSALVWTPLGYPPLGHMDPARVEGVSGCAARFDPSEGLAPVVSPRREGRPGLPRWGSELYSGRSSTKRNGHA